MSSKNIGHFSVDLEISLTPIILFILMLFSSQFLYFLTSVLVISLTSLARGDSAVSTPEFELSQSKHLTSRKVGAEWVERWENVTFVDFEKTGFDRDSSKFR